MRLASVHICHIKTFCTCSHTTIWTHNNAAHTSHLSNMECGTGIENSYTLSLAINIWVGLQLPSIPLYNVWVGLQLPSIPLYNVWVGLQLPSIPLYNVWVGLQLPSIPLYNVWVGLQLPSIPLYNVWVGLQLPSIPLYNVWVGLQLPSIPLYNVWVSLQLPSIPLYNVWVSLQQTQTDQKLKMSDWVPCPPYICLTVGSVPRHRPTKTENVWSSTLPSIHLSYSWVSLHTQTIKTETVQLSAPPLISPGTGWSKTENIWLSTQPSRHLPDYFSLEVVMYILWLFLPQKSTKSWPEKWSQKDVLNVLLTMKNMKSAEVP